MRLAFDDYGPGPVVVLLHGFPFNRSMWSAQESSVGSIYRVIAPDLRGHGESAAPDGVYTMEEMAGDVMELLDSLHLTEPVVLGGLSMGGYVALALMDQHPERFRALMLMDTRASADTPDAARLRLETAGKVEASGSTTQVVEGMYPKLFAPITLQAHPERIARVRPMMEKTNRRAVVGAMRGMAARHDRSAELTRIKVPTLVMVGAHDVITPPEEARSMAEVIPNARLEVIPDAGHLSPMENPAACDEAILRFLAGLP